MNRLVVFSVAVLVAASVFAKPKPRAPRKLYVKPGSAVGFVAVVNAQTKVPESEFVAGAEEVRRTGRFVFKFVKTPAEAKGAAVVITVVDATNRPPMTVSPEVGRGEMNVGVLVDDLKSPDARRKFLPARARREFMRTVAYAFGAGSSQFPGNIMAAVKVRDLDYCEDFIPADTAAQIVKNGKKMGLVPERATHYAYACEEGWAPPPTTDEEREIWNEVRAVPSKPLQLKK